MKGHEIYFFDPVEIKLEDFSAAGMVLDIGGGGEGIIGRLKGRDVVSIDKRKDELLEAPDGPVKIVMDARALSFPGGVFSTAAAFFSLMYFADEKSIQAAFAELFRVLQPGARFHFWDVNAGKNPEIDEELFAVRINCWIRGQFIKTAYGCPWPQEERNSIYYRNLLEDRGFHHIRTKNPGHTFYSCYIKP